MNNRGYLPCFSRYLFVKFPPDDFYQTNSYITKVKNLLSAFIDSRSPYDLSRNHGIGKEIQPIRPGGKESNELIKLCGYTKNDIYRIDYGDNKFRIVFGLSEEKRLAYIFIIDTKHKTFKR